LPVRSSSVRTLPALSSFQVTKATRAPSRDRLG
jgi:hypothetical protein